MSRPHIPKDLRRKVLVEAGHRCALPACRQIPVEIAHIIPWNKVKVHTFENLIALCANCHMMHHRGDIDRKSLQQYKANLSVLNSRYGDLERRVLTLFSEQPEKNVTKLPGGNYIFLKYLIDDGYIAHIGHSSGHNLGEFPNYDIYELTSEGREFINRWLSAKQLE